MYLPSLNMLLTDKLGGVLGKKRARDEHQVTRK